MILLTLIWYVVVNKQQLSQNVSSTMKHVIRTFNAAQIGIAGMFAFSFHACCFCCDPATSNKRFFAMSALSVENKCWRLRWLGVNISLESLCTHPGALVVIPMNDCAHIHSFILFDLTWYLRYLIFAYCTRNLDLHLKTVLCTHPVQTADQNLSCLDYTLIVLTLCEKTNCMKCVNGIYEWVSLAVRAVCGGQ